MGNDEDNDDETPKMVAETVAETTTAAEATTPKINSVPMSATSMSMPMSVPVVDPNHTFQSPTAKVEATLLETLNDCQIRTEVGACLDSILLDVETTFYLQQKMQLKAHEVEVNRLRKEHAATIMEADAERSAREEKRLELADAMVQELMGLSIELEKMMQWKKHNEHKVNTYDDLVAKLAQTEEELQAANRVSYGGGPKPRQSTTMTEATPSPCVAEPSPPKPTEPTNVSPSSTNIPKVEQSEDSNQISSENDKLGNAAVTMVPSPSAELAQADSMEKIEPTPASTDAKPQTVDNSSPAETDTALSTEQTGPAATAAATETGYDVETTDTSKTASVAAAVVSLDDDEPQEEVPGLVDIDVEILMTIFGFLDAMDILNTAQINITMYNRVDNIFGISEDGHSRPQPPPPPPKKAPAAPAPAPRPVPSQPAVVKPAPAPTAKTPVVSPTVPDSKPAATASNDVGQLGKGFFSMLQPRPASGSAGAAKAGGGGGKASGRGPALNASVAQSMAQKLSDAELAAIITMTDRLSKMEREVMILRNEREGLSAKLDGTEAVKQFLISKVRDVELKLNRTREEEVKVTQQIASDQEVIAFLDSRVQELERASGDLTEQRDSVKSELQSVRVSTSKKITVLSDMLKYEREKLKEEAASWKATKKLLVKEVKSCRAQILALQAERDGYKEQNEMLKRAITSTGKNVGVNPNR